MRYLATIEYNGTNYAGWQIQPNGVSIQEEVEKVISRLLNTPTKIYGSGRTDAGVHAHGQTFHFDADIKDLGKFKYSLNSLLPRDMHVINIEIKGDEFNARYDVKAKTYIYYLNMGEFDPFNKDLVYQFLRKLDVDAMKKAIALLKGEHCFMNFTSKEEDKSNFVRNIYEVDISVSEDIVKFSFVGNGFMRYMIRMIVGTLIEVGLGKMSLEEVSSYLDSKDRKVISYKAPACGLYLEKVKY